MKAKIFAREPPKGKYEAGQTADFEVLPRVGDYVAHGGEGVWLRVDLVVIEPVPTHKHRLYGTWSDGPHIVHATELDLASGNENDEYDRHVGR